MSETLYASLSEPFVVTNRLGEHTWISDEPMDLGGKNEGPKPTELLLSALASCKLITLKMYADRKGWELGTASIELHYIEKGEKTIIGKKLTFSSDMSEEQYNRLKDISGRCPVAKMLQNSIEFQWV